MLESEVVPRNVYSPSVPLDAGQGASIIMEDKENEYL